MVDIISLTKANKNLVLNRGNSTYTVAKKSFPSSLPTPSITLSNPDSVTADFIREGNLGPKPIMPGKPGSKGIGCSPSSREGNAQSISSIKKIARLGIEEAALCRNESSTLRMKLKMSK